MVLLVVLVMAWCREAVCRWFCFVVLVISYIGKLSADGSALCCVGFVQDLEARLLQAWGARPEAGDCMAAHWVQGLRQAVARWRTGCQA